MAFKYYFTDGTFITMLDYEKEYENILYEEGGATYQFILPNFLFSVGLNTGYTNAIVQSVTKTDYGGNTWTFNTTSSNGNTALTITNPSGTSYTFSKSGYFVGFLTYDKTNNVLYYSYNGQRFPYWYTGDSDRYKFINGYNTLTSGIKADMSLLLADAEYNRIINPVSHTKRYQISNLIIKDSNYQPPYTINLYDYTSTSEQNISYITAINGTMSSGRTYGSVQNLLSITDDTIITEFSIFGSTSDPYSQDPEGSTNTGGGTGTFDITSDPITIPSIPTLSAAETGFITLFNPSISQLKSLASYMWDSSLFDVSTWQKIFADPMQAILGLTIVPVAVPTSSSGVVKVGNISTGISMPIANTQYVEIDCGTLDVKEYWGAYLDYEPYTKAEIYLPYCGTHAIATDDIMNKSVQVVYHIDILSGACCAYVKCGESVLYSFIGQCSSSIPVTGNDMTNVINGVISIAGSVGSMVATGGKSAISAVTNIASTAINNIKPEIEKSGAMSGTGGLLAIQTPYLILTRPRQALPANQNKFMGYPSFIKSSLAALSGYTEIESVHLENIPATETELFEIENLLKSGVIL